MDEARFTRDRPVVVRVESAAATKDVEAMFLGARPAPSASGVER
jgi:hypothetical protein